MSFSSTSSVLDLSVLIPFHNEQGAVRDLFVRLQAVLEKLGLSYEIVCVDDGSTDRTYEMLLMERQRDERIKPVRLSRNFGKESALTCGLNFAKGRAAVTMDGDLQHPPEVISDFVTAWRNGAKMVYGIRRNRDTDGFLRRLFSRAFYAFFHKVSDLNLPEGAGDFRLLDRVVIDEVNALPEKNRFMKGLMTWAGHDFASVSFDVEPRVGGKTNWNFFRLVRFAFDGISSFSTLPLRVWTWCGSLVSLVALAYGLFLIVRTILLGVDVPGYASLMVAILFLGGVQLLSLGIIGEYLARVFVEVKGRPAYVVADKQGFDETETS